MEPEQIELLAVMPDDVVQLEPEQIKLLAVMPDDVVQLLGNLLPVRSFAWSLNLAGCMWCS